MNRLCSYKKPRQTPISKRGKTISKRCTTISKQGFSISKRGTAISKRGFFISKRGSGISKRGKIISKRGTDISKRCRNNSKRGFFISKKGASISKIRRNPSVKHLSALVRSGSTALCHLLYCRCHQGVAFSFYLLPNAFYLNPPPNKKGRASTRPFSFFITRFSISPESNYLISTPVASNTNESSGCVMASISSCVLPASSAKCFR